MLELTEQVKSPVLTLGSTSFLHVRHSNLYVVGVTRSNVDAGLVFEFLYKLIELGTGYFGKFDEEAVKNNFALVYELLDEVLDFGFPQNTDLNTLKQYITTESVKKEATKVSAKHTCTILVGLMSSKNRPRLQCRRRVPFHGGGRISNTGRTRCLWTSTKISTF